MYTIGIKQFILILIIGFLLFGNVPKRQNDIKKFISSSKFQDDLQTFKNFYKEKQDKLSQTNTKKEVKDDSNTSSKDTKDLLYNSIIEITFGSERETSLKPLGQRFQDLENLGS